MNFIEEILAFSPIIGWYLLTVNVICFAAMGIDKYKAKHQKWRIPERTLFIFAAIGGSVGGILGIYTFRHKTLHKKFTIGFPAILVVQAGLVVLGYFVTQ